jgi:hypothetical protein
MAWKNIASRVLCCQAGGPAQGYFWFPSWRQLSCVGACSICKPGRRQQLPYNVHSTAIMCVLCLACKQRQCEWCSCWFTVKGGSGSIGGPTLVNAWLHLTSLHAVTKLMSFSELCVGHVLVLPVVTL